VVNKIIELHLRPINEKDISTKAQQWTLCLIKMVESIPSTKSEQCIDAIEQFLNQIRGREIK
jgi:hypothetical protein